MRINFVIPSDNLSGGIRVVAMYAKLLHERGHTVTVTGCRGSRLSSERKSLRQRARRLLKGSRQPVCKQHSYFDGFSGRIRFVPGYRPIVDADLPDADVVVATWWETAEWVSKLSASKGVPIYFIQGRETHDHLPADRVTETYRLPMFRIAVSEWIRETLKSEYGISQIEVVPNSVDFGQFYAAERDKQPIPTFGTMYSPREFKGFDTVFDAVGLARQRIPELRFIAFGHVSPPPKIAAEVTEYYVRPEQSAIREIYEKCDAWLFGSRSEGFGLPVLEAMACRTPVIGTPAGAAPELIRGGCGQLVSFHNADEMSTAICRIANMSSLSWCEMSTKAYRRAHSYSWDDAADQMEAAFETALSQGNLTDTSNARILAQK